MQKSRPPSLDDQWRAIILFGRNVASYKFALAKTLLELQPSEGQLLKLEELSGPFSKHVADHLKLSDRQGTSATSKFLDTCRQFNQGQLTGEQLGQQTVRLGFNNVIDAFHFVGKAPTPEHFFADDRTANQGIRITAEFSKLLEGVQSGNLMSEVESRWRLVETAWDMGVSRSLLNIDYDAATDGLLAVDTLLRRHSVTGSHGALNGYQKGRCFYCFRNVLLGSSESSPEVDHFFPHALKQYGFGPLVDGIWNLVLACKDCNRGVGGKSSCAPTLKLVERLSRRNEHLISSQHPLRETILMQTGLTQADRRWFLNDWYQRAWAVLIHQWEPDEVDEPAF